LPPTSTAPTASPFRSQITYLTYWAATVTVAAAAGVASAILSGDTTELVYPVEVGAPVVNATVRIGFGQGGRCAIVGVLGGT
jgi:hypothetical protein